VDQAGRIALRRHAQRHDRALALRLPGDGEIRQQFARLFAGMTRLSESSVVNIKNKMDAVTAEIVVPDAARRA